MTEKPNVRLLGTDGNVFAIIAKVSRELRRSGQPEAAKEYRDRVFAATSYDEALMITLEYVDLDEDEPNGGLVFEPRGLR